MLLVENSVLEGERDLNEIFSCRVIPSARTVWLDPSHPSPMNSSPNLISLYFRSFLVERLSKLNVSSPVWQLLWFSGQQDLYLGNNFCDSSPSDKSPAGSISVAWNGSAKWSWSRFHLTFRLPVLGKVHRSIYIESSEEFIRKILSCSKDDSEKNTNKRRNLHSEK